MKLEDCKPGVRVRVYDGTVEKWIGIIKLLEDGMIGVVTEDACDLSYYYPQQLRKIAPKKDKPTVFFAFNPDGSWNMPVALTDSSTIDLLKRKGCDVWVMRGIRKL